MFSTASFRKTLNFACQLAVQLPFGQNVNWRELLTSVFLVAEMTGKSHCSYCTDPETLNLWRTRKSARCGHVG